MAAIDDSRRTRAHVDGILLALVFGMAVFGVVAVCVATFSPDSDQNASFLNHVVNSSYALKQCLFLMLAPLVVGVITVFPHDLLRRRAEVMLLSPASRAPAEPRVSAGGRRRRRRPGR